MERSPENTRQNLEQSVRFYEAPLEALEYVAEHPPTILCGITSAGKDTVARELVGEGTYELVISNTTRKPRINDGIAEEHNVHYVFNTEEEMLQLVRERQFFEVKEVHGNFYGTRLDALKQPYEHEKKALLVIDFQGALEFVSFIPSLRPIFLLPPDVPTWRQRLSGRGEINEADFHKRLVSAEQEIQTALDNPAFQLVINYEKDETAKYIQGGNIGRDHSAVEVADRLLHQIKEALQNVH